MKKERLFYLDFIRAIATILILMTHFNAVYIYSYPQSLDKAVITCYPFNIYIGGLGVALFFIISGASLMYVYSDKLEIKTFFKKRFLSLFPLFWFCYVIFFAWQFWQMKGIPAGVPKINMLLTIIGFDGYLAGLGVPVATFYILGEWFLGAIILLYLVFPLLRIGVKRHPIITGIIIVILYILGTFVYQGPLNKGAIIINRIPELAFGMYFVEYWKKISPIVFIISILVLIQNTISHPAWSETLQTTYVGIAAFCVLVFIAQFIKWEWLQNICRIIGKYSYAVFLVHHVLIYKITATFDMANISRTNSYLLFLLCVVSAFVVAFIVFQLQRRFDCCLKAIFTKKVEKNE